MCPEMCGFGPFFPSKSWVGHCSRVNHRWSFGVFVHIDMVWLNGIWPMTHQECEIWDYWWILFRTCLVYWYNSLLRWFLYHCSNHYISLLYVSWTWNSYQPLSCFWTGSNQPISVEDCWWWMSTIPFSWPMPTTSKGLVTNNNKVNTCWYCLIVILNHQYEG